MNEEARAIAFKTALTEIRNVCPEINKSLILMDNGSIISGADQDSDPNLQKAVSSIEDLAVKTASVGGLDGLLIDGEDGRIYVSNIEKMYFVASLSKQADLTNLRAITGVVFPTIIKVLNTEFLNASAPTPLQSTPNFPYTPLKPAPLEPYKEEEKNKEEKVEEVEEAQNSKPLSAQVRRILEEQETDNEDETDVDLDSAEELHDLPSQQLIVDRFGGLMVRSDTVQIDSEVLERWTTALDVNEIREVDVETFSGKTCRCKVKLINDQKLAGRGLIRIPEKTCDTLELKRGELVKVKPVELE